MLEVPEGDSAASAVDDGDAVVDVLAAALRVLVTVPLGQAELDTEPVEDRDAGGLCEKEMTGGAEIVGLETRLCVGLTLGDLLASALRDPEMLADGLREMDAVAELDGDGSTVDEDARDAVEETLELLVFVADADRVGEELLADDDDRERAKLRVGDDDEDRDGTLDRVREDVTLRLGDGDGEEVAEELGDTDGDGDGVSDTLPLLDADDDELSDSMAEKDELTETEAEGELVLVTLTVADTDELLDEEALRVPEPVDDDDLVAESVALGDVVEDAETETHEVDVVVAEMDRVRVGEVENDLAEERDLVLVTDEHGDTLRVTLCRGEFVPAFEAVRTEGVKDADTLRQRDTGFVRVTEMVEVRECVEREVELREGELDVEAHKVADTLPDELGEGAAEEVIDADELEVLDCGTDAVAATEALGFGEMVGVGTFVTFKESDARGEPELITP